MATYPQGVTSFIPSYQPFQLDWNVLARNVQLKQTKYDQNWQKLNNIYGALYNSQVSNPESQKVRENLLKQIEFDVNRVAGLDLSLQSNVTQAEQIFKPFYQNTNLIADIVKTKEYNNAMAYGQSLKTSKNKAERDMYWGGGFEYLNNRMEEFKALPFEQISGFGTFQYSPYVNVDELSNQITKDMGDMTIEYKNGRYIYKDVNGDKIIGTLNDVLQSRLGSDPAVQEFYSIQEYNKRKRKIKQTLAQNPNLSKEQAEMEYLNTKVPGLILSQEKQKAALENQNKVYKNYIKEYKSAIAKGSEKPGTELKLKEAEQALAINQQILDQVSNNMSLLDGDRDNKTLLTDGTQQVNFQDLDELRRRVIPSQVQSMINTDLLGAAERYSRRNMSRTMKADPFAKIDYQLGASMKKIDYERESGIMAHKRKGLFDAYLKAGYYYDPQKINSDGSKGGMQYDERLDQNEKKKEAIKKINDDVSAMSKEAEKMLLKKGVLKEEVYTDEAGKTQTRVVRDPQANYTYILEEDKTYDPYVNPEDVLNEHKNVIKGSTNEQTFVPLQEVLQTLYDKELISDKELSNVLEGGRYIDRPEDYFSRLTDQLLGAKKDKEGNKYIEEEIGTGINIRPPSGRITTDKIERDVYLKELSLERLKRLGDQGMNMYSPEALDAMVSELQEIIEPIKTVPSVQELDPQIKQLTKSKYALEDYLAYKKSVDDYMKKSADAQKAILASEGFAESSIDQLYLSGRQASREEFVANMFANESSKLEKQIIPSRGTWYDGLAEAGTAGLAATAYTGNPVVGGIWALGTYGTNMLLNWGSGAVDQLQYGSDDTALLENANLEGTSYFKNVTVGDEYENMIDVLNERFNREQLGHIPLPGLQPTGLGPGSGKFTIGATAIDIIPGGNTFPNQLFKTDLKPVMDIAAEAATKESNEVGFLDMQAGIRDKILYSTKGIDMQDVFEAADIGVGNFSYKMVGPEEGADLADPDNNEESAGVFKSIYTDLKDGIDASDPDYTRMTLAVSPMGGGQFERMSVIIRPSDDYIDKKYKGEDYDELRVDLKANGVAAMIPKNQIDNLENIRILANSYMDPLEARVRREKSVTYTDPMSNATINFQLEDPNDDGGRIKVVNSYDIFNPNQGKYEKQQVPVDIGASSLTNIRTNFLDNIGPQLEQMNARNYADWKMKQALTQTPE